MAAPPPPPPPELRPPRSAATEQGTKLVVFTVIARVPKNLTTWGDVYAVETKHNYFGDIESFSVQEVDLDA